MIYSLNLESLKTHTMKKILGLITLLVLASCSKDADYLLVSGKIINSDGNKITITGDSFEKELTLKPDGTFSDTLDLNYSGAYAIKTNSESNELYLMPGKHLEINADYSDLTKSIAFTGDLSAENNYIKAKTEIKKSLIASNSEFYALSEEAFKAKVDELVGKQKALAEKTKFDVPSYKDEELKNIDYAKALAFLNYPSYHAHYAEAPDYKPSATFPKFDDKVNLDNEKDFYFSNAYKQIVSSKFYEEVEKNTKSEEDKLSDIALPFLKKIKSQNIKNALATDLAYDISPANEKSQQLFDELNKISTNELFKTKLAEKFEKVKKLAKGQPSPSFNYENYKGGTTSLESLKGKYVYVDVWATWCGPCKQEIPSLKATELAYRGKNIEFVSLSIDQQKDHETWKKMVADLQLEGIQLMADKDWKSQFAVDYAVDGIPRFILIDPNGNIVSADAPRPSDPKLKELFTSLKI